MIYRTGVVTSLQQQSVARELSDIYIEPPVKEFGLTDYKSIKRLADIGYTHAQRVLAEHKAQIAAWRANGS